MNDETKTIVIDNFDGAITPSLVGSLNSGLQPLLMNPSGRMFLGTPHYPQSLQFFESTTAISAGDAPTSVPLHCINAYVNNPIVVAAMMSGSVCTIGIANVSTPTPDLDSVTNFTNSVGDTLNFGGSMFYDASAQVLVIGTDSGVYYSSANPLANAATATFTAASGGGFAASMPRPSAWFLGSLYVGDGNKLVQMSSNYQSVLNTSVLNPTLPVGWRIRSLQVSPDGRYLIMTATQASQTNDFKISGGPQPQYQPIDSVVVLWNGSDTGYTSLQYFKGLDITCVSVSSTDAVMFAKSIEGTGIYDLNGNLLSLISDITEGASMSNNYASYPPGVWSVDAQGKKFFFLMQLGQSLFVFCYDLVSGKLYSILQDSVPNTGSVAGGLKIVSNHQNAIISNTWSEASRAKLYYFYKDINGGTPIYRKYYLHLQNYGGALGGSYATQVQEFPQKVQPVRIRVYTEPTVSGVGFIARLYDAQLNNITGNQTYTFAAGTNTQLAQGALNKIEFGVNCRPVNGFLFNILPSGATASFYIEKVEIDYLEVPNPPSN